MIILGAIFFILSCGTLIAFAFSIRRFGIEEKNIEEKYWERLEKRKKEEPEENSHGELISASLLIASLLLSLGWIIPWGPFLQPLFLGLFYEGLGFWIILLIVLTVAIAIPAIIFSSKRRDKDDDQAPGLILGLAIFLLGFFGLMVGAGILAGPLTKTHIYKSLTYEELAKLPQTSAVRYLPLEVASRFGATGLQDPGVKYGDADPIVDGNKVNWILTRVPKGFWNSWLRKADGFSIVHSDGTIETIRQEMTIGEGMLGTDNIMWKLRQSRYWSKVTEIYYLQENGEVIAVAPFLNYSFKFPVMVPRWGGVFLVHSSGEIERLSPDQAINHPLLKDARIFPETLARLYVESFAYKNGISNAFFTHADQLSIPEVGTSGNEMPFLVPTETGQKWFVATVPWGAQGIYRIFFVDAITGEIEVFTLPNDGALKGPSAVREYVKTAFPTIDWNAFLIIEPRPVIEGDTLHWMFTITPSSYSGVKSTVLVNAATTQVLDLGAKPDDLLRFLETGSPATTPEEGPDASARMQALIAQIQKDLEELNKLLSSR